MLPRVEEQTRVQASVLKYYFRKRIKALIRAESFVRIKMEFQERLLIYILLYGCVQAA